MPIYEFEAEDGEQCEVYFSVDEAPHIGDWVEFSGKSFQRVVAMPQIANSKGTENYRLHSEALPNERMVNNWERQAFARGLPPPARAPRYDELGRATFRSERELHEYCKRDGRYAVGNPKEVGQEMVAKSNEKRKNQLDEVKERERAMRMPEVH